MKTLIPCYYASYGRYISRFRAIPYYIDYLKPVERRLLLSLNKVAKKLVKSSKVVGHTMAELHPHGDLSIYQTLQQLVINGFVHGEGNWGSPSLIADDDYKFAAARYTECKIEKWVSELAFNYINFVPWTNYEYEDEPTALPSPIPIGLIGKGINIGIAFHKNQAPRYTIKDLSLRLKWLLEKNPIDDPNQPIIIPNIEGCNIYESDKDQIKNILLNGHGSLKIEPKIEVKNDGIHILGRSPLNTFNALIRACEVNQKTKKKEIPVNLIDSCKDKIDITVIPDKKSSDVRNIIESISSIISQNINIDMLAVNDNEHIENIGVDQLLLNSFMFWRSAVFNKRLDDTNNMINKKFETQIILLIRQIINQYKCNTLNDILNVWNNNNLNRSVQTEVFNNNWAAQNRQITDEDIENVYKNKSIKKLVESNIDLNQIDQEILTLKNKLNNLDNDCYSFVVDLSK